MNRATLRPVGGLVIRHPHNLQPLSKAGDVVELSTYWLRRLRAGEVERVDGTEPETPDSAKGRSKRAAKED